MWPWLARIGLWLVQLLAGPAAAREAGRLEQQAAAERETLTRTEEVRREQAAIAAGPAVDRNTVLERMRNGTL